MKSLTDIQLNRIKIRDLIEGIKHELEVDNRSGVAMVAMYTRIAERALEDATDEDLRRIEQLYIRHRLEIEYFPLQNKKKIKVNGETKIVPIEYLYGSENT